MTVVLRRTTTSSLQVALGALFIILEELHPRPLVVEPIFLQMRLEVLRREARIRSGCFHELKHSRHPTTPDNVFTAPCRYDVTSTKSDKTNENSKSNNNNNNDNTATTMTTYRKERLWRRIFQTDYSRRSSSCTPHKKHTRVSAIRTSFVYYSKSPWSSHRQRLQPQRVDGGRRAR